MSQLDEQDILRGLQDVLKKVFVLDDIQISRDTTAFDINGWDSLSHAIVLCQTEAHFDILIPVTRAAKLDCIGQLVDLVRELKSAKEFRLNVSPYAST